MISDCCFPGIVVTVKQRQEFRIRLQKRARRAAEKKLEAFESEKLSRTVGEAFSAIIWQNKTWKSQRLNLISKNHSKQRNWIGKCLSFFSMERNFVFTVVLKWNGRKSKGVTESMRSRMNHHSHQVKQACISFIFIETNRRLEGTLPSFRHSSLRRNCLHSKTWVKNYLLSSPTIS